MNIMATVIAAVTISLPAAALAQRVEWVAVTLSSVELSAEGAELLSSNVTASAEGSQSLITFWRRDGVTLLCEELLSRGIPTTGICYGPSTIDPALQLFAPR